MVEGHHLGCGWLWHILLLNFAIESPLIVALIQILVWVAHCVQSRGSGGVLSLEHGVVQVFLGWSLGHCEGLGLGGVYKDEVFFLLFTEGPCALLGLLCLL